MKNLFLSILIVSVLAISVTGCADTDDTTPSSSDEAVSPTSSAPSSANENINTTGVISVERAKEIALDHAGLTETDVTFVKTELDTDDGRQEYEIEFYSGSTEYEYDIDATTGTIVSSNVEPINDD